MSSNELFKNKGVLVKLNSEQDFLKIKETLERIGISSKFSKVLYQSCHILHKQGQYVIIHFKELFELDGRKTDLSDEDIMRRNRIAKLLEEWKLLTIIGNIKESMIGPISSVKIVKFNDKNNWQLKEKYRVGKKLNN